MTAIILLLAFASTAPQKHLEASDRSCLARLELGDVEAARTTCASLSPATHPIAAYWHALLERDSTQLRKLLEPEKVAALDPPGKRILMLAGRYQFAAGKSAKVGEIAKLLRKHYPKCRENDTLEELQARK